MEDMLVYPAGQSHYGLPERPQSGLSLSRTNTNASQTSLNAYFNMDVWTATSPGSSSSMTGSMTGSHESLHETAVNPPSLFNNQASEEDGMDVDWQPSSDNDTFWGPTVSMADIAPFSGSLSQMPLMPLTVSPRDALLKSPQDEYYYNQLTQTPSMFTLQDEFQYGPQFVDAAKEADNYQFNEPPEVVDDDEDDDDDGEDFDDDGLDLDLDGEMAAEPMVAADEDDLYSNASTHGSVVEPAIEPVKAESFTPIEFKTEFDDLESPIAGIEAVRLDSDIGSVEPESELSSPAFDSQRHLKATPSSSMSSASPASSSSSSSSNAESLAARKKALSAHSAGPHRCEMSMPNSPGVACGKVFSRPYDLIRHQDTIHASVRKMYHCEMCGNDSKTFSRMDALSRHIRVKHAAANKLKVPSF